MIADTDQEIQSRLTQLVESDECYTPHWFVDPIRRFTKHFTLDPFSSSIANERIQARHYLTINDNAYDADWSEYFDHLEDSLWVNPPYSRGKIAPAIDKTLEYVGQADIYLLVNSETSSNWYQKVLSYYPTIIFPSKRMKFFNPYRLDITNSSKKPQTLFYFGNRSYELLHFCRTSGLGNGKP
jgi:hypothetical protein